MKLSKCKVSCEPACVTAPAPGAGCFVPPSWEVTLSLTKYAAVSGFWACARMPGMCRRGICIGISRGVLELDMHEVWWREVRVTSRGSCLARCAQ
jgi:hypothetical protein